MDSGATTPGFEAGERGREGARTVRTADGRRICYATYGVADGRPVLFLHGVPGSRVLGSVFDDAARRNGVRILAPDRPGYGRSDPWPGWGPAAPERFCIAILDDAGVDAVHVVGFSGGSAPALGLAAARSDLVTAVDLVSAAVPPPVANSQTAVQRLLGLLARRAPRVLAGSFRCHAWVARRVGPSAVVGQLTTDDCPDVPDAMADVVYRDFLEAVAHTRTGVVAESCRLADWDPTLETVEVPVRLWHGRRDANVPVDGVRRFADRLPNGELRVLEDCDHLLALRRTRPKIISQLERVKIGF